MLLKINLINVALTGNPINPSATMTSVMAKSLDWLKEQEDKMQTEEKSQENNVNQYLIKKFEELKSEILDLKSKIGGKMEEENNDKKPINEDDGKKENKSEEKEEEVKEEENKETEEKGINKKSFDELKSQVEELSKQLKSINEVLEKPATQGKGPENKSEKEEKKETKSYDSKILNLI